MSARWVSPGNVAGRVLAPPSKSYTHRALVVGHLAGHRFRVVRPLDAEDTRATRRGIGVLGSRIRRGRATWIVEPDLSRSAPRAPPTVDCGESGTTFRLLLATAARLDRPIRFDGRPQLRRRPIEGLLEPLRAGGADVRLEATGSLPLVVQGPLRPGRFVVDGSLSSQYLSALLLVLPTLPGPSTLRVSGTLVSAPYVAATEAVARAHGVALDRSGPSWTIPGDQEYRGSGFTVPGDASSAAYFWAAGALAGGPVRVDGVPASWPQADRVVLDVLRSAGASVRESSSSAVVSGPTRDAFEVDLTDAPDLFPLVGVIAAATPGRSTLTGAPHLAVKETDRRTATIELVRSLGASARNGRAGLEVVGRRGLRRMRSSRWADHRLVMSAAVGALCADGPSRVGRAEAVAKSFPGFWAELERIGAKVAAVR